MRDVQEKKDGVRRADKKRHNRKRMKEMYDEPGVTLWMSSINAVFSLSFGLVLNYFHRLQFNIRLNSKSVVYDNIDLYSCE